MLFKDLSIDAIDNAQKKYRDELLDLDHFQYEFTAEGELIKPPDMCDMFGQPIVMGDVVYFPYSCGSSYWTHTGRVNRIRFLKQDHSPMIEPTFYSEFRNGDPIVSKINKMYTHASWYCSSKSIRISRAQYEAVNITKLF
jgi:hypothetical protein